MALSLKSSGGGSVTIADPASTASNFTLNPPLNNGNLVSTGDTGTVTPTMLSQKLTQGTAVASTSGTSIDFTSIPSWVKRITVMLSAVSTSGTSDVVMQIGGGSIEVTGYSGVSMRSGSGGNSTAANTAYFNLDVSIANAAASRYGTVVLTLLSGSTNTWTVSGNLSNTNVTQTAFVSGSKATAASLDRVRITTAGGTDTFDAGSINILYEG